MHKNVFKNKKSISIDWKIVKKWNYELMGVVNPSLRTNLQSRWLSAALPPHLPGANELTFVWRHPNVNFDDTGLVLSWSSVRRVHVCVMNQFWYTVDQIKAQSTSLIIYGNRVIYVRSTCQGNIIIMIMVRCMKINNHKNWLWVCDQMIVLW